MRGSKLRRAALLFTAFAVLHVSEARGQIDATKPSKEYIRLNGQIIAIENNIPPAPIATLSLTTVNFGTQVINSSTTDSGTLTNTGTANLTINSIVLAGSNSAAITQTNNCAASLAPGANCTYFITYAPTDTSTSTASITITDNSGNVAGAAQTITITGTGATGPIATLSTSAINFGTPLINSSSTATASLTNTGTATLTIGSIVLAGSNSTAFTETNNCGTASLSPGASCTFSITYTPTDTSTSSASVTITDNSGNVTGSTQMITLSGTGFAAAVGTVSPVSLTFAAQTINTASATQSITLSSTGSAPLTITSIASTGTNSGDFSQTNNCGTSLAIGSSCSIIVTFTPTASGTRTAAITITDNSFSCPPGTGGCGPKRGGTTQTVNLTGNGGTGANAALSSTAVSFTTAQPISTTSAAQTVTLTNNGSAALAIAGVTFSGANPGDFAQTNTCGASVATGASCTLSINFTPTAAGSRSANLVITDNSGNVTGTTQTITLSGTGLADPIASLSPSALNFGPQIINNSYTAPTVTLTNNGSAPLLITSIALASFNSNAFTQTNNCGSSLAAGASCTFAVTFSPNAVSTFSGTITITDNSGNVIGTTQTMTLSGSGIAAPNAGLAPTGLTFAAQIINTTSASQTLTLSNSGSAPLAISSLVVNGTNPGDFAQTNNCGSSLPNGASCSILVTFKPTASGTRLAAVTITDNTSNLSGATQVATLTGTGTAAPSAALSTTAIAFTAAQTTNTTSSAQTLTLSNNGSASLAIANITLSGTNPADFAETNTCGTSLANGANCTISVTFTPTATGARNANLVITDNSGNIAGTTQTILLSGTGIAPVPLAVLSSTNPLNFGSETNGVVSAAQTVTLTNKGTGTASLAISSIAMSGANPGDFAVTNTCGTSLANNASCNISVTFKPTATGARSANLVITDNSGNFTGTTQTIAISGTGVAPIPLAVLSSTNPLSFGAETTGYSTAAQTVTLTNKGTGTVALSIASVALSGTNPGDFAETNTCGTSLANGASCTVSVTFKPTATGARSANLVITDNSGNVTGTTQTIALSGTGVAPAPVPSLSTTALVYSSQSTKTTSAAQVITLTNTGTAALAISAIALSGANPGDFALTKTCTTSLAINASCTISVTFTPTTTGTRTASVVITDNAGNVTGSTQTVTLTGTGIPPFPLPVLSTSALTFTSQTTGIASAAQTITLSNKGTGTVALTIASIALSGTNPGDFAQTNNCGTTLANGASCTISVTFKPTATGSRTANVVITDNSNNVTGSTQAVTLTGTGIPPVGVASLSPTTITFAADKVGVPCTPIPATLTNTGTGALTITSFTITGTNASDFSETNTCGTSLAAGAKCTVSVGFTPKATGTRSASLVVTDNSGNVSGATQTVALSGTGK